MLPKSVPQTTALLHSMNQYPLLARTDSYLCSQFRDSRTPWNTSARAAPFITISREAGSGGSCLGSLLARKLNAEAAPNVVWRVYEGDVTAQMLKLHSLPLHLARFLPEDRSPEVNATIGELLGLHPNLWELKQKTTETMRNYATQGHVILVGRGANFATSDLPNGIHVRLVAPVEHRARYLAQRYNIPESEAMAQNARCETARRRYVRENFGADVSDPLAYDLTINTGRVTLSVACGLISKAIKQQR